MRTPSVVKLDPIREHATRMLQCLKAMAMHTLLFQGADDTFNNSILLRRIGGDKFLLQAVTADQCSVLPTTEDEPIVRPQQEGCRYAPEGPESREECLF